MNSLHKVQCVHVDFEEGFEQVALMQPGEESYSYSLKPAMIEGNIT